MNNYFDQNIIKVKTNKERMIALSRSRRKKSQLEFAKEHSEHFAIQFLQKYYPEFKNANKRESPDFSSEDGCIGMEVVRAENEKQRHSLNLMISYYAAGITEKERERIMAKMPKKAEQGFYDPCRIAKKVYLKKRDKLNDSDFEKFNKNYLIIISEMDHFMEQDMNAFLSFLSSQHGKSTYDFDVVFVISYEHIMKFESINGSYEVHNFDRDVYSEINRTVTKLLNETNK